MSRISDPKWRDPPNYGHIMVLQIGGYLAQCSFWDWCYATCKSKVIGLSHQASVVLDHCEINDTRLNKYHAFSYGEDALVVLIENADDAVLIKLTWSGQ
jgi:hypothetical protein